jgi:N-acetylglucosaminyl-diphospho-decaprenol L-rhamnosyltransferase
VPADVAVAIVSWNTRDLLRECLRSLEGLVEAEVWVVDNASTDGSAEMVRDEFPSVRLEALEENLGFGRAVNLVAARTSSPWIAPANADIALRPGALAALLSAGSQHPEAGILAPRLELPSGETQHSVYAFPTVPFTALFNVGLHTRVRRLGDAMCLEGFWDPERERDVDWAMAAFLLVRRTAWEAAGGFDDQQWMYAEDLDLGWRVARAGFRTRYVPQARVLHHASAATTQAWGDERTARWLRSTYSWMLRRRGIVRTRLTAAINVAGAYTRALLLRSGYFRMWGGLHRRAGFASRGELEGHR